MRTVEISAESGPGQWTTTHTVWLSIAGEFVAKWTCEYRTDRVFGIGERLEMEPDPNNRAEWRRRVADVADFLGDNGWEMVAFTNDWTVLRQGTQPGWQAAFSSPFSWTSMFKRPRASGG